MWVRMSTFQGVPDQSDEQIEANNQTMRDKVLPMVREIEGFKGVLSVGDKVSGKGISLTFWETEEALKASEEAADRIRQQAADQVNESIAGVERFEVYIYELPEP